MRLPVGDLSTSATSIYRACRAAGITPGGTVDCLIAAVAKRTGASLLARDADMSRIARAVAIGLDPASSDRPVL
jgi:predicted nucleic acid-binding protein